MKFYFNNKDINTQLAEVDFSPVTLMDSINKTRRDLEIAYAGFDNAVDADMIDSYIYEIKALQMRYQHLTSLVPVHTESAAIEKPLHKHTTVQALVSQVLG